jgi:glycosyltransferase involved in cell wall biosynthesis
MTNKTILHITGMSSYKYGAIEKYLLHLAASCAGHGFHTVLQYEENPTSSDFCKDLDRLSVSVEIRKTHGDFFRVLLNSLAMVFHYRPQIIHVHFPEGCIKILIPLIARLAGTKKILYTVHNKPPYSKPHISRFIYNLYDILLPVSRAVGRSLELGGVNPKIISPLYLGLFGERHHNQNLRIKMRNDFQIPANAIVLACIAFDDRFKGVDLLLESFATITKSRDDVYLLSIGIDPKKSHLVQYARQLGIKQHLIWAGIVDHGWQVLNAADIYVQPSRDEEGLPLAIMEAMAMHLPIVCTDVSGNIEAVIDQVNGLVAKNNSHELAEKIAAMLSLKDKWQNLGEAGYQRYLKYFRGEDSIKLLVERFYQLQ